MQHDILAVLGDNAKFFAETANGRLHCNLTNIDVLPNPDSVISHLHSKRFKAAKTEAGLKQFGEYIVQSPEYPDKLLCTLTGALINKNEDAVWKHMTGKKFERLLSQKEAEKAATKTAVSRPAPSNETTPQIAEPSEPPPEDDPGASSSGGDEEEDDEEFWVPPPGARRDEDREAELAVGGEDVVMGEADESIAANGHAKKTEVRKRAKKSKGITASHRDKRTTKSVGPAENAPQKKKRRPQG